MQHGIYKVLIAEVRRLRLIMSTEVLSAHLERP